MQHVWSKSNIGLTLEDMLGCAPEIGNFANSAYSISINVSIQSKSKSIKPKLHIKISIYLIPSKFFNQMFICIITIKNNFNSICEVSMKELEGVSNFFLEVQVAYFYYRSLWKLFRTSATIILRIKCIVKILNVYEYSF